MNLLITASWDKTLRFWDCRQPTPVNTQQLAERVYAMDVNYPLAVVGTADRNLYLYNLTQPQQPMRVLASQLKCQTRCIACFPDKQGYLVGSIEGRVSVQHVDEQVRGGTHAGVLCGRRAVRVCGRGGCSEPCWAAGCPGVVRDLLARFGSSSPLRVGLLAQVAQTKNFTFKCHRDNNDIYAVNSISFHPVFGTFATSGSDGTYTFWDKDSKQRLMGKTRGVYANNAAAPIPSCTFNRDGTIFAYAVSYDWSKGFSEYQPQHMKNTILLHPVKEDEIKAKPKQPTVSTGRR